MIDTQRVLAPLDEVGDAVRKLHDYQSQEELSHAVREIGAAVDRSLRALLRSDPGAPDSLRLAALSAEDLPSDRLIESLRQQNRISLELAGMSHELARAVERAAGGAVRAGDADVARRTVERVRQEVHTAADAPVREVAHSAVAAHVLADEPAPVPPPRRRLPRRALLITLGVLVVIGVTAWFMRDRLFGTDMRGAVEAFNNDRLGVAETGFRRVLARDDDNISAMLYLARILRREGRHQEAADLLKRAVALRPQDGDVRREVGSLFLDLKQPDAAAEQYRLAVNAQPAEKLNWIGLVRALRDAGRIDAAEQVVQKAPAEAQAALRQ